MKIEVFFLFLIITLTATSDVPENYKQEYNNIKMRIFTLYTDAILIPKNSIRESEYQMDAVRGNLNKIIQNVEEICETELLNVYREFDRQVDFSKLNEKAALEAWEVHGKLVDNYLAFLDKCKPCLKEKSQDVRDELESLSLEAQDIKAELRAYYEAAESCLSGLPDKPTEATSAEYFKMTEQCIATVENKIKTVAAQRTQLLKRKTKEIHEKLQKEVTEKLRTCCPAKEIVISKSRISEFVRKSKSS